MGFTIRKYQESDIPAMTELWNAVVRDANAFPQDEVMNEKEAAEFFAKQTFTGAAVTESGELGGLYILHPNNIGRCGHLCNASYAVSRKLRGRGIGEALVKHSLEKGKELGFRILQFNAVTESNKGAQALYAKLGFTHVGTVPNGFLLPDGKYEAINLYYKEL